MRHRKAEPDAAHATQYIGRSSASPTAIESASNRDLPTAVATMEGDADGKILVRWLCHLNRGFLLSLASSTSPTARSSHLARSRSNIDNAALLPKNVSVKIWLLRDAGSGRGRSLSQR